MRSFVIPCALAAFGGVARAQAGTTAPVAAPATVRSAPGDSLRLTRRQAIAMALHNNPQLEIAREQTAQARAQRVQATALPDPTLEYTLDDQRRFLSLGGAGARNLGVGMTVPFPDKLRLQGRVASANIRASESNYALTAQQIAFATSSAYDDLLAALRHRGDLVQARGLASDFLARTRARFNAGTVPKLDVINAQVNVAQADNDLIANQRDISDAQTTLDRLIGRVQGAPVAPADSLDVPPPLPDSATVEALAIAQRPELAAAAAQQQGARTNTSLLREFWIPDFTLGFNRDYLAPGSAAFSAGIAMPVPLLFWQHTRGEIAESQHRERELAATYRDVQAQVLQDVRAAYAAARTATTQAVFLRDQLVPAAAEAYRISSTSYGLGGSSALEVLSARQALLSAQTQLSDALAAANTAYADLERALGTPLTTAGARP